MGKHDKPETLLEAVDCLLIEQGLEVVIYEENSDSFWFGIEKKT